MEKKPSIDKLARMISEDIDMVNEAAGREPGGQLSPSQIFSQAFYHGWDSSKSIGDALREIMKISKEVGADPELTNRAVEYTKLKYQYVQKMP